MNWKLKSVFRQRRLVFEQGKGEQRCGRAAKKEALRSKREHEANPREEHRGKAQNGFAQMFATLLLQKVSE